MERQFGSKDLGLFLDLMAYSIICENNAGQYYPMYAYGHPLFTEGMRIYSDSKISDFLCGMTGEESVGFLNDWNSSCDHREKIYISYDSTNKNSEAGNIEMVEFGEAKVDVGLPIFNYSVAYDTKNAKSKLYLDDEKDRYFHIYHSTGKEHGEKEELEEMLERLGKSLRAQYGTDYQLSDAEKEYFDTFMTVMGY